MRIHLEVSRCDYRSNETANLLWQRRKLLGSCFEFFKCHIPILLVVKTGDMGSALIFMLMFIGMMFAAGLHWLYFPAGLLAVAAVSPIVWYKVFDNIQRNRILTPFY